MTTQEAIKENEEWFQNELATQWLDPLDDDRAHQRGKKKQRRRSNSFLNHMETRKPKSKFFTLSNEENLKNESLLTSFIDKIQSTLDPEK